jgi:hypothetical protein
MSEPDRPKAIIEKLHDPYIITGADGEYRQVRCATPGCNYEGPGFDGPHSDYLAELNSSEHIRACVNEPGTAQHE